MRWLGLVSVMLVVACGPMIPMSTDDGSSSGDEPSTGAPPPPSSTSAATSTSTSTGLPPGTTSTATGTTAAEADSSDEGVVFLIEPDGGGINCLCCDVFAQDCPDGEKCNPWANDGGDDWNGTRCSPIEREPGASGDPCTVVSSAASGVDSCDLGSLCWAVDPDTMQGTCTPLCEGSEANPMCPPGTDCLIANDGVLALCLPTCDPLAPAACGPGHACLPSEHAFACVWTGAGESAAAGEACAELYDCQPGLMCRSSASVGPPCDAGEDRCCTPYCDLTAPDPTAGCLDPGQACTSWWGEEPLPIGLEHVGLCVLPA